jgi:two-component system, cell cycle response regulator
MHGRILFVDGTATNRIIYKVKLSDAFYEPLLAADGAGCLKIARTDRPDLILLDLALPDMSGTEVLRHLRADPATRPIPVVVLAGTPAEADRQLALAAGADDVMAKPVTDDVLLARLRNLLRQRDDAGVVTQAWGTEAPAMLGLDEPPATFEPAGRIGLVAARSETALGWKHLLQRVMRDRLSVMTREQALALPTVRSAETPDIFLIEADLDGRDVGLRLLSELRSHAGTRRSAFCIIAGEEELRHRVMAYDLGADDVVAATVPDRELELRLRALLRRKRQADRLRETVEDGLRMAMVDPLTGVHNRRYALPRLAGIAAQAASEGADFAIMVVDLDRFKAVNDAHGHAAGDAVLVEVARRLTDNLRMHDLLARIGGEEFLVALPQTSLAEAERVAERLRRVIGDDPIPVPGDVTLRVTVSIGVAVVGAASADPTTVTGIVEQADQALLTSKTSGRNTVTFSRSAA